MRLAQWLLIALSGALMTLSFPPFKLYWLVWIALIPLFLTLQDLASYQDGFLAGFFMGLVHVSTAMYWISISVHRYGGINLWGTAALTLLFILYLSFYWGLVGIVYIFLDRWKYPYLFPFAATLVEYLRGLPLTRFPWGGVEMALPPHLAISQIVDIIGIYGLGFLIYLINLVTYRIWLDLRMGRQVSAIRQGIVTILILAAVWVYGVFRIPTVLRESLSWKKMRVCVVQPNIDQSVKWEKSWRIKGLRRYLMITQRAVQGGYRPDLVIWPEAALTFYINENPSLFKHVIALVRHGHFMLIFGATSYELTSDKTVFHNSAYILSRGGKILDRYDKVRLVPFGEYVPLRRWFPFIKNIVGTEEDFTPGKYLRPLKTPEGSIGVTICFEGIFPGISRTLVRKGARLLVNITNDAWFGRSSEPYQHLRLSAFRAVEERCYLVRSTETGISAIVGPTGRILVRLPLYTEGFSRGIVRLRKGPMTFYARFGDVFILFCALFILVIFFYFVCYIKSPFLTRSYR